MRGIIKLIRSMIISLAIIMVTFTAMIIINTNKGCSDDTKVWYDVENVMKDTVITDSTSKNVFKMEVAAFSKTDTVYDTVTCYEYKGLIIKEDDNNKLLDQIINQDTSVVLGADYVTLDMIFRYQYLCEKFSQKPTFEGFVNYIKKTYYAQKKKKEKKQNK